MAYANKIISEATNNKIQGFYKNKETFTFGILILLNTLYIKLNWQSEFKESKTADRPFHTESGQELIPTMYGKKTLNYLKEDSVVMVEMKFKEGLEILVIMPENN